MLKIVKAQMSRKKNGKEQIENIQDGIYSKLFNGVKSFVESTGKEVTVKGIDVIGEVYMTNIKSREDALFIIEKAITFYNSVDRFEDSLKFFKLKEKILKSEIGTSNRNPL